jgi:hypothetical protein
MVELEKVRGRFQKSLRFSEEEKLSEELREIFCIFQPTDFSRELYSWQRMALSNDQSAYDRGESREDLIDFGKELNKLIAAFHLLHRTEEIFSPEELRKAIAKHERKGKRAGIMTIWVTKSTEKNPYIVIKRFCNAFTISHSRAEILDMLDAVITYEGYKKVFKTNLVLMYRCLLVLITLAHRLNMTEIMTGDK